MPTTPTTEIDFWKWLRENASKSLTRFGQLHPFLIRQKAMECFHLQNFGELILWQKKNSRRIMRTLNEGLRPLGLKAKRPVNGTGYLRTEKIAA